MKFTIYSISVSTKRSYLKIIIIGLLVCIITLLILSQNNELEEKNNSVPTKVLCYILLPEKKIWVAKIVKETWGSRCDKILFYGNFVNSELPVIQINATEGYEFLWGKTKAALIHLREHFSDDFDWFLKADLDTFVVLENLRRFIFSIQHQAPLWFGFKMKHKKMTQGYMSGGAGYVFNKEALTNVTSLLMKYSNNDYYRYDASEKHPIGCRSAHDKGIEDLELGRCFHSVGVKNIKTTDEFGRERFLPLSLSSLMSGDIHSSHWIWSQSWNDIHPGKNCCSSELISMHEVPPSELRILYFLLYKLTRPPLKVK